MPVEIKKLTIKAVIDSPGNIDNQPSAQTPVAGRSFDPEVDMDLVVKNCVKQVMQILKQTKQR